MRVGIIAEGPADVAVLMNILHGALGLERKDVLPIRPELTQDETDLSAKRKGGYKQPAAGTFSNWTLVLAECRERTKLADFLDSPIAEERLLAVHIDTAEAELKGYEVTRLDRKAPDYVEGMRASVVAKLEGLLGKDIAARTRFAVAVEETDAWLLALLDPGDGETGLVRNPKKKLERFRETHAVSKAAKPRDKHGSVRGTTRGRDDRRERTRTPKTSAFEDALAQSEGFRDPRTLDASAAHNRSLALFVDSLQVGGLGR